MHEQNHQGHSKCMCDAFWKSVSSCAIFITGMPPWPLCECVQSSSSWWWVGQLVGVVSLLTDLWERSAEPLAQMQQSNVRLRKGGHVPSVVSVAFARPVTLLVQHCLLYIVLVSHLNNCPNLWTFASVCTLHVANTHVIKVLERGSLRLISLAYGTWVSVVQY